MSTLSSSRRAHSAAASSTSATAVRRSRRSGVIPERTRAGHGYLSGNSDSTTQRLTVSACVRGVSFCSVSLQCLFPRLVRDRYAGSISRLRIHACLPTCRPLVNPYRSNSSAVALNRNRP